MSSSKVSSCQTGASSSKVASRSSNQEGKIRRCLRCPTRMSSTDKDPHLVCSACRGLDCWEGSKCLECRNWSLDIFSKYLSNQRVIKRKRRYREKVKDHHQGSVVLSPTSAGRSAVV